jgi:hypothetical protein
VGHSAVPQLDKPNLMATHRKRRRVNVKGRSEVAPQFWMLTYSMARSKAFRSLSGAAVKILIELRCRYNTSNATELFLSYGEAASLLGLSKTTVFRAFQELKAKGFTRLTRQGLRFARLASQWYVTDIQTKSGEPPPNDWRRWQPPSKIAKSVPRQNQERPHGSMSVPKAGSRSATGPILPPDEHADGSASVQHINSTMCSDAAKPPASEAAERSAGELAGEILSKVRLMISEKTGEV